MLFLSVAVAQGYGGVGFDLATADSDVIGVFKAAQAAAATGTSALINAHIGSTSFRDGSVSV